jgi:hypothetical protein
VLHVDALHDGDASHYGVPEPWRNRKFRICDQIEGFTQFCSSKSNFQFLFSTMPAAATAA